MTRSVSIVSTTTTEPPTVTANSQRTITIRVGDVSIYLSPDTAAKLRDDLNELIGLQAEKVSQR